MIDILCLCFTTKECVSYNKIIEYIQTLKNNLFIAFSYFSIITTTWSKKEKYHIAAMLVSYETLNDLNVIYL